MVNEDSELEYDEPFWRRQRKILEEKEKFVELDEI